MEHASSDRYVNFLCASGVSGGGGGGVVTGGEIRDVRRSKITVATEAT